MAEADATLHPFAHEGRKGQLAYFDADMEVTTPDQAVLAKAVYDDGGTEWFVVAPAAGDQGDTGRAADSPKEAT